MPTRLFVLLTLAASSALSFGQGTAPGTPVSPGGGTNTDPTNSVNWKFTTYALSGKDEFNRLEWNSTTSRLESHNYVRSWLDNIWVRDGVPQPMMDYPIPVVHESRYPATTASITMTSRGVWRVKAEWIGQGNGPSYVRVKLTSSAWTLVTGEPGGMSAPDNGLGDPPLGDDGESGPNWRNTFSFGNHLRQIKLTNKVGYFDVQKSAVASNSGVNAGAYASAHNVTAVFDPRQVNITTIGGQSNFFKKGAVSSSTFAFSRSVNGVSLTNTFAYQITAQAPVEMEYPAQTTNYMAIDIGIPKMKVWSNQLTWNSNRPQLMEAFSYFPDYTNYSKHGDYTWTAPRDPNATPGTLDYAMTAYSNANAMAVAAVDMWDFQARVWTREIKGTEGQSDTAVFKVNYPDGVVGTSTREITWHKTAEVVTSSAEVTLFKNELPVVMMTVFSDSNAQNGWVKPGVTSHKFTSMASSDLLGPSADGVKIAALLVSVAFPEAALVNAAVAALSAGLDFAVAGIADLTEDQVRGGQETIIQNGTSQEYQQNPNLFYWRLGGKPAMHVRLHTVHQYNANGYVGTAPHPEWAMEPARMARRILYVAKSTIL